MSSSLLTNTPAMAALQNLAATEKSLNKVQNEISTGLSVASASDNAAYWSISTTMKSDTSALGAVTNALNLGSSVVNTAASAISSVTQILQSLKADLVTAQTSGADRANVQTDITAQQQSLRNIIASASFNQVNLLDGSTTSTSIVSSFARTASGNDLGVISVDTSTIRLVGGAAEQTGGGLLGTTLGILNVASATGNTTSFTTASSGTATAAAGYYAADSILAFSLTPAAGTSSVNATDLSRLSAAIDNAISKVTAAAAQLGQYSTTINSQVTYVTALSDAITSGVGSLVDADMNVASTRLSALQTQEQLGVQSLSIANQNAQLILKLFE